MSTTQPTARRAHQLFAIAVLATIGAVAQPAAAADVPAPSMATRGIATTTEFRATGPMLRATADQSRLSPVLVRIADARPGANGDVAYRVEFIGLVAGDYDVRDYLERQDGSPLNLSPMPITVVSKLDASHGTDLFLPPRMPLLGVVRYRVVMVLLGVLWLSVPLVYLIVRLVRRVPPPIPVPVVPPPSLAEQLQPLAEAAIRGSLSLAERARLELLMYLYWRDRLKLDGPQAAVVQHLRRDAEAGGLLRAIESWLHARMPATDRALGELATLLDPYRSAKPISINGDSSGMEGTR